MRFRCNIGLAIRLACLSVFFCAFACCVAYGRDMPKDDGPANPAAQSIHDEANRILSSVKSTKYVHTTDIDEKSGQYYCDCSGFVGYVLNRTVANDDHKGPLHDGDRRPVAAEYERGFEKAPTSVSRKSKEQWQQIVKLEDARPGDVIAWRLAVPKPNDTGHVVIVDERPVVESDGIVKVVAIDSTVLPSADLTPEKGKTGIGRRTMWFTVDKDGRPTGYIRGSRTSKPKTDTISIGRAIPDGGKTSPRTHSASKAAS